MSSKLVKKPVVAFGGGSGSGKTTYCKKIKANFEGKVTILSLDNYYKNGEVDENGKVITDFDHPDSLDLELFEEDIAKLKNGKTIKVPIYDFVTHKRKKETTEVKPATIIIVEGILIYNIKNLKLYDLKIYMDADLDIRYRRRLERDQKERGRSIESINKQWDRDVKTNHYLYVEPFKKRSDLVINNHQSVNKQPKNMEFIFSYIESIL